jgi:hypothetical protein
MLRVSMPKRSTAAAFVDTATKCRASACSGAVCRNHARAVWTLVSVS